MFKIIEVLGMPPDHIITKASRAEKFFERTTMGTWVLRRPRDGRKVKLTTTCRHFKYHQVVLRFRGSVFEPFEQ